MKQDLRWLEAYAELLQDKVILELGCGPGLDSDVLSGYANTLVCGDLAPVSGNQGLVLAFDHSEKLPFQGGEFDVVVASLCLHYFRMKKTKDIIAEITRVLKPQGSLICRLNSYKDENYGSTGFPEIESGLYDVNGEHKRFFRRHEIESLWARGYSLETINHKSIDRYEKTKWVYEFCATRLS